MAADVPIQFRAILYCPLEVELRAASGFGRSEHGVNLCAKRILVQHDCRDLLPEYLRFLYGLVDSEDLPLNVSRETLQDNTVIRRIRNTLVKGVLDRLHALADEKPDDYLKFYREFGTDPARKEVATGHPQPRADRQAAAVRVDAHRRVGSRVEASRRSRRTSSGCIADQKRRDLQPPRRARPGLDQEEPQPRDLPPQALGLEVLFLGDPIDEFVMSSLRNFDGKPVTSIDARPTLDLPAARSVDSA